MEKIIRTFSSHGEADEAARDDDDNLTPQDRFTAFMKLMEPYYAAAGGFQRVYRVDDRLRRSISDDWRLRVQPLPQSEGDR